MRGAPSPSASRFVRSQRPASRPSSVVAIAGMRAEQAFGFPAELSGASRGGLTQHVPAEDLRVDVGGEVVLARQVAAAVAGHRDEQHEQRCRSNISRRRRSRARASAAATGRAARRRGSRCAMRWSTPMMRRSGQLRMPLLRPSGIAADREAEQEQHDACGARWLGRAPRDLARRRGASEPRRLRERDRDADDEQEEREHQVGGRAAVPVGVPQRRVDVAPVAGVVHEDHQRDVRPRNASSETSRAL